MSEAAPARSRPESDRNGGGLFPTERQIAARLGIGEDTWRRVAAGLEKHGLPRKDPVFDRRYWPAVRAWLDKRHRVDARMVPSAQDGEENWQ